MHDSASPVRTHGALPFIDPVEFGRAIEGIENCAIAIKGVANEVQEMRQEVKEVRDMVQSKPDKSDVEHIIADKLTQFGFEREDYSESKADFKYLRAKRLQSERLHLIKTRVTTAIATTLILGMLGWSGNTLFDGFKVELKETPKHETSQVK